MVTHTKRTQRKEAREGHHLYRRLGPIKSGTRRLRRRTQIHQPRRQDLHLRAFTRLRQDHQQPHGTHGGHRGARGAQPPCEVEVHSDSQYVVNAFNKHWIDGWKKRGWKTANKQPVKNRDLWERLLAAKSKHKVEFIWVKGHAGHELNERCDELATTAADGSNLDIDTGFNESDL